MKLKYSEIDLCYNQISKIKTNMKDYIGNIKEAFKDEKNNWESDASKDFFIKTDDLLQKMDQYMTQLENSVTYIKNSVGKYKTTDSKLKKQIERKNYTSKK